MSKQCKGLFNVHVCACVSREWFAGSQRQTAMQRAIRDKQRRYGDRGRVPYTYRTRWSSLVTDCNSVKSDHNQQVGLRRSEGGQKMEERMREGMCKKYSLHGVHVSIALCSDNNSGSEEQNI